MTSVNENESPEPTAKEIAALARRLLRTQPTAALATRRPDGWPYASLVLVACRMDATPLLLISDIAVHTKNIAAEPRVSLLFDGTVGLAERLTGARVSVLARAVRGNLSDPDVKAEWERYVARHPSAAGYIDFHDFAVYRLELERAHLVAGFGRIHWVEGPALRYGVEHSALAAAEADILAHMNADHREAIGLYATKLLGLAAGDWEMSGIDPEGCDLRSTGASGRLDFDQPVHDAEAARTALVGLVRQARSD